LTIDFELSLGSLGAQVDVSDQRAAARQPPATVVGRRRQREQIESLPLNGRSFLELARLEPGVGVESVGNPGAFGNNYHRVSIGGSPYLQTHVTVDGSTIDDRLNWRHRPRTSRRNPIQEFQIASFNLDPGAGMTATGAVNVVTRRGSNQLHGSAFFYYRDHNLAAYPALQRDPQNPERSFGRRQAGLSLGGPTEAGPRLLVRQLRAPRLRTPSCRSPTTTRSSRSWTCFTRARSTSTCSTPAWTGGSTSDTAASCDSAATGTTTVAPPSTGTFMPSDWGKSKTRAFQVQAGATSVLSQRLGERAARLPTAGSTTTWRR
jgi:hypothetical protein